MLCHGRRISPQVRSNSSFFYQQLGDVSIDMVAGEHAKAAQDGRRARRATGGDHQQQIALTASAARRILNE